MKHSTGVIIIDAGHEKGNASVVQHKVRSRDRTRETDREKERECERDLSYPGGLVIGRAGLATCGPRRLGCPLIYTCQQGRYTSPSSYNALLYYTIQHNEHK